MHKRSSKQGPEDTNEIAFRVFSEAIGEVPPQAAAEPVKKNAAAVELGRLGGRKGGAARAAALTPEQRSEIAKKAAQTRWQKKQGEQAA